MISLDLTGGRENVCQRGPLVLLAAIAINAAF